MSGRNIVLTTHWVQSRRHGWCRGNGEWQAWLNKAGLRISGCYQTMSPIDLPHLPGHLNLLSMEGSSVSLRTCNLSHRFVSGHCSRLATARRNKQGNTFATSFRHRTKAMGSFPFNRPPSEQKFQRSSNDPGYCMRCDPTAEGDHNLYKHNTIRAAHKQVQNIQPIQTRFTHKYIEQTNIRTSSTVVSHTVAACFKLSLLEVLSLFGFDGETQRLCFPILFGS